MSDNKTNIEILHRHNNKVLFRSDSAKTVAEAVIEAIRSGANLSGADLGGANLRGANLRGANLGDADLSYANLGSAYLRGAYLRGADLSYANLSYADLSYANLGSAYLRGADLRGADLSYANLSYADLSGVDLSGANLGGANLSDGVLAHADSRFAFAGPVGNCARPVFCFLAQPNEVHVEPWLVFRCGCFIGDEAAYLKRIENRYGEGSDNDAIEHANSVRWLAECNAALVACKATAATWQKPSK